MAITVASRALTDNLRKMRRFLQGRGVNIHKTIVASDAVYAADRITVPGLKDDDAIVSVFNVDAKVEVTGYLDILGEKATLTVFSANKGIVFTAVKYGPDGNKIYVSAAAAAGNSLPLSATIGAHPSVSGSTLIAVALATDGAGAALTDGSNSALKVAAAIRDAMNVPAGGNGHIVAMAQTGTGATDWTAQAATPLSGGESFKLGPSAASLLTDPTPYDDAAIRYVAKAKGVVGNSISVAHTAGGALAVAVTGSPDDNIVVTYVVGETTAQQVIDAVNAHAEASALVIASNGPGSDGSGVIETMLATSLAGGVDSGIKLTEDSTAVNLEVEWVSKD